MHVDTSNAVHPLTGLFGLLKRAGYEVWKSIIFQGQFSIISAFSTETTHTSAAIKSNKALA